MSLIHDSNDSQNSTQVPTMVSSFGALLVEKLKRIQDSIAAMAGLASDAQSQPEILESRAGPGGSGAASQSSPAEPLPSEVREGHRAAMLTTHGVRVRDFAYESKLPPVPSYKRPIIAGARRLKRTRGEYETECSDEDEELVLQIMARYSLYPRSDAEWRPPKKAKVLERTNTEPVEESQGQPSTGFADISEITNTHMEPLNSQPPSHGCPSPPVTPRPTPVSLPRSPFNPIQSPRIIWSTQPHPTIDTQLSSHDDEPWVNTPKVTPDDVAEFPFARNNNAPTPPVHNPTRSPFVTSVTFSGINFNPSQSQHTRTSLRRSLSRNLLQLDPSPMSRSPSLHQLPTTRSRAGAKSIPRRLSNGSMQGAPQPRYHLRDRSRIARTSPSRAGSRPRSNSRAAPSSSANRPDSKPRSSLSRGATQKAVKSKSVQKPKSAPALRRSSRNTGLRA